jgi:putative PIN family toxin of toxin-antitoxin system
MIDRPRLVVDNNALISRLLLPASIPGQAVRKAVHTGQLLISEAILEELADVLSRPKFDRYVSIADRQEFIRLLGCVAEMVPITYTIRVCRDPKDDKILEAAVNGSADIILTGDRDLLALHPFHDIAILSPSSYLRG